MAVKLKVEWLNKSLSSGMIIHKAILEDGKIQQIIIWAVKGPVSPSKTLTIYKKFRHSSHQSLIVLEHFGTTYCSLINLVSQVNK